MFEIIQHKYEEPENYGVRIEVYGTKPPLFGLKVIQKEFIKYS